MWFKKKKRIITLHCPLCGKRMEHKESIEINRLAVTCDDCRLRIGQEDLDRMRENWRTFGMAEASRYDMLGYERVHDPTWLKSIVKTCEGLLKHYGGDGEK